MQVTKYAKGGDLINYLSFYWGCPTYLQQHRRNIYKDKSRNWKRNHKYGIQVRKSVEEGV